MDVVISPGQLSGKVRVPPSKSASHRALICAMLAEGSSLLTPYVETDDMLATMRAAVALGADCRVEGERVLVKGASSLPEKAEIDCGESGSTLRFLIPIAAALGVPTTFSGRGRLPQRPNDPLTEALETRGVRCHKESGQVILRMEGKLQPGRISIAGDVSSQYVTGLLFALPLLAEESEILLTTPLQSRGYVDMTLQMLERFGIEIQETETGWRIPEKQRYRACDVAIEGDYSGAAFWLCAGAIGSYLSVGGLAADSLQGDRAVVEILERMGCNISRQGDLVAVEPVELRAVDIDAGDIPDLVPALAVALACARGTGTIYNAQRLRIKESDRLRTVTAGLQALGAQVEEQPDKLIITGKPSLDGGVAVDSYGDHRIAMAMSIAALRCREPVTVQGAECVSKSYPDFYEHFRALGGNCHVV